jgi:uncharacterized membrane protein
MTRTTTKDRRRRDLEEDDVERDELEDDGDENEGSMEDGGSSGGVFAELKNVASDAALSVLAPVAKKAATSAAKYAVKKGPELLEDTVMPKLEEAGGVKGLVGQAMSSGGAAGGMLSKLTGGDDDEGGGGDAGDGTGKGRRMPVQQAVDVAAPIDVVYDQWTQFEDYPKFMHRVQRVEQRDDSHVAFHAKVWGINRMWEAEIVEQRPDERIVFKSVNGVQLTGVVTFHDMAERLTHIELNIDVDPNGPIEKIARGTRVVKRAARADLKRFKAYVEMHEDETGAWRGEIQDGDVVSESDEGAEDEYEDDDTEASAEEDEDTEASAEDEEPDEDEDEDEADEEEEKPAPKRRRSTASKPKSRSNGGDPKRSRRSSASSRKSPSRSRSSNGRSTKGKSSGTKSSRSKAGGRK